MAIDFLIGALLLLSALVNILALGAFWVTPSLRTTANRFVINLLIVNLVGCIILAPSLLLNSSVIRGGNKLTTTTKTTATEIREEIINATQQTDIRTSLACESNGTVSNCTTQVLIEEPNSKYFNGNEGTILIAEIDEEVNDVVEKEDDSVEDRFLFAEIRCWPLDVAAALGALSVVLVVGDTWCAVTDPLRYHSRISGPRAWLLIGTIWFLGAIFGIASAFRSQVSKNFDVGVEEHLNVNSDGTDIYNTIFSCSYFVVVILLPFGLVCGMYWRIFSEARENGLRMRQNGSSPLLQSALNLAAASAASQYNTPPPGGLTLKIDKQMNNNQNNSHSVVTSKDPSTRPLLAVATPIHHHHNHQHQHQHQHQLHHHNHHHYQHHHNNQHQQHCNKHLEIPRPNAVHRVADRNQNNILLSLEVPAAEACSAEQMRRNHSARQLCLLDAMESAKSEMRHVHSTPNLQKLTSIDTTAPILPLPTVQVPPKALGYMTSIRHRLSNASSLFKYREESRAARISILVVIMFLVSYIPFGLLVLTEGHNVVLSTSEQTLLAIFTVVLANLSSPFIFAYRNKRVRRGVRRLLGIDAKTNERLQRRRNTSCTRTITMATKIQRNTSKASTYSVNSCKYLTPHSAATLNGTFVLEIEKCQNDVTKTGSVVATATTTTLSTTIITDRRESSTIFQEKRSFLKRVCDTSRKWGCTSNSCASSEQTDV